MKVFITNYAKIYEKEDDIISVVNVIPRDRKKADKLSKRMRGEDEV